MWLSDQLLQVLDFLHGLLRHHNVELIIVVVVFIIAIILIIVAAPSTPIVLEQLVERLGLVEQVDESRYLGGQLGPRGHVAQRVAFGEQLISEHKIAAV